MFDSAKEIRNFIHRPALLAQGNAEEEAHYFLQWMKECNALMAPSSDSFFRRLYLRHAPALIAGDAMLLEAINEFKDVYFRATLSGVFGLEHSEAYLKKHYKSWSAGQREFIADHVDFTHSLRYVLNDIGFAFGGGGYDNPKQRMVLIKPAKPSTDPEADALFAEDPFHPALTASSSDFLRYEIPPFPYCMEYLHLFDRYSTDEIIAWLNSTYVPPDLMLYREHAMEMESLAINNVVSFDAVIDWYERYEPLLNATEAAHAIVEFERSDTARRAQSNRGLSTFLNYHGQFDELPLLKKEDANFEGLETTFFQQLSNPVYRSNMQRLFSFISAMLLRHPTTQQLCSEFMDFEYSASIGEKGAHFFVDFSWSKLANLKAKLNGI